MKLTRVIAVATVSLAGGTAAQAADLVSYEPTPVDQATLAAPGYFFSIEALGLWRNADDILLAIDGATGEEFTTDGVLGADLGAGARVTFGGELSDGLGFEISGLFARGSSTGTIVSPTEDLFAAYDDDVTPGNLDFLNSDIAFNMDVDRDWLLAGVEASATYAPDDAFRLTFGPAWLRYSSTLHTVVYDEENTTFYIDDVSVASTNDLLGGKFGIEGMVDVTDTVSIGGRAAVGLYAVSATLDRSYESVAGLDSPFATPAVSDSSTATGFAQSFELSPRVAMAVSPTLSLSLGADFLYLNGVDEPEGHYAGIGAPGGGGDLAPDSPDLSGSVMFGGVSAGLHGQF